MERYLNKTEALTPSSALAAIAEVRQRMAAMGGNDSEFFQLNEITEKLGRNEIEPEKAVEEANRILNGKEDYH